MKNYRLNLSILLTLFCTTVNAQWSGGYLLRYRDAHSISIADHYNAIIVGGRESNSAVQSTWFTNDRGTNWGLQNEGVGKPWFKAVQFLDTTLAIVVGDQGTILRSVNKGLTWDTITTPVNMPSRNFNAVFFVNQNVGYVAGGFAHNDSIQTILKTTNGGNTWTIQRDGLGNWLRSIFFTNIDTGFGVGDNGVILKTTNGGTTWSTVSLTGNIATRNFNGVYFLNGKTGLVVGGNPTADSIQTILRTTNGGITWTVIRDSVAPMLNAIDFANNTKAFAVGDHGTFISSNDAGLSWKPVALPDSLVDTVYNLYAVNYIDTLFGVVAGQFGRYLQYTLPLPPYSSDSTLQATEVTSYSAILHGLVNPHNTATKVMFEFGTTTSFGNMVAAQPDSMSGGQWQEASLPVNGLQRHSFYYYRIRSENYSGISYGDTIQFYTSNCEIPNCDFEEWDTLRIGKPLGWSLQGEARKVTSYNSSTAVELQGNYIKDGGILVLGTPSDYGINGGIPFAERPDSILLHARYNIALNDSGFIVWFFKKGGSVIYFDSISITGNSGGNFVEIKAPMNFPTADIPDTMSMGIASSNIFNKFKILNKHSVLAVDDIHFAGTSLNVPNPDFEIWDTVGFEQPRFWASTQQYKFVSANSLDSANRLRKVTDAFEGSYALQLQNSEGESSRNLEVCVGDSQTVMIRPVFPVAGRHNTLNFFVKYLPQMLGFDTLRVICTLFKAGAMVGGAHLDIGTAISVYTPISCDILYMTSDIPDSASLIIELGTDLSQGSATAFFDAFSFDGFKGLDTSHYNAIQKILGDDPVRIFPNPANDQLNIQLLTSGMGTEKLEIFDISGRLVFEKNLTDTQAGISSIALNTGQWQSGYYIMRIISASGSARKFKFAIVR